MLDIAELQIFRSVSNQIYAQLPMEVINSMMHPWVQQAFLGEVKYHKQPIVKASISSAEREALKRMMGDMGSTDADESEKHFEQSTHRIEEQFSEEFPDYEEEWQHVDSLWMFIKIFRWLLNLAFIAIPYGFLSQIFLLYNLWFNIKWNFLWAGGNVFLLANTIYAIQQTLHSVFVISEVPLWMKFNKGGRWLMLALALIYNTVFIGIFADFLALLYYYDKKEYSLGYILESMFFSYNIVLHFPITIVNAAVIVKEFSLEFFQMSQKKHGQNDHLALGIAEWLEWLQDIEWVVDPNNYEEEKKYLYGK